MSDHLHEGILVTQLTELFHAPSPTRIQRKLLIEFLPVPNSGLGALVGLSTGNEDPPAWHVERWDQRPLRRLCARSQ